MLPIAQLSDVHVGDVIHQDRLGFAVVDAVLGKRRVLQWERAGPDLPAHIGPDLDPGWMLALPGGFTSRAVLEPEALRQAALKSPGRVLHLLLDEIDGSLSPDEVRAILGRRDTVRGDEFPEWWSTAKRALESNKALFWDEGRVASMVERQPLRAATQGGAHAAAAFLRAGPTARFRMVGLVDATTRDMMMGLAIRHKAVRPLRLLLRGQPGIPNRHAAPLLELAVAGDPGLCADLLDRGHTGVECSVARMAADPGHRSFVRRTLAQLTHRRRVAAVMNAMAKALEGHGGESAALFLADEAPGGAHAAMGEARRVARTLPPGTQEHWRVAFEWLSARSSEVTIDRPVTQTVPLLTQLRPLPAKRAFGLSISLVQALTHRQASGQSGGLLGARVRRSGRVELGVPDDSRASDDVHAAMRLMLEVMIGQLPKGERVPSRLLLAHAQQLIPGLSPDWVAVASLALSEHPTHRPRTALDLWSRLARSAATAEVRAEAPRRRDAHVRVGCDTHIGAVKARMGQVNQDAMFSSIHEGFGLFIVADGISVSTAGSGNLASSILVQIVVAQWEQHSDRLRDADGDQVRAFLDRALASANRAVCEGSLRLAGGDLNRHIPMGTTAVVGIVQGDTVHIANLGDSRAYLRTASGLAQLTGDQNLRSEWLRSWQGNAPIDLVTDGHALTGYVGHFDEEGAPAPAPPAHVRVRMLPGETLLICSDGLTDYISDTCAGLAQHLEKALALPDLDHAARALVTGANAGGGGDNITVMLLQQALA